MPTNGGYLDPNRPDPLGPHDANVIIYGCVLQTLQILEYSLTVTLQLRA